MTAGFGPFDATCHGRQEHEWQEPHVANRACTRCGVLAAEFFHLATSARTLFFGTIRAPASAHGSPRKPKP
jgi:hypothetical protein